MSLARRRYLPIALAFTIVLAVVVWLQLPPPAPAESRELLLIQVDGRMGVIDREGVVVIEPRYERIYRVSTGGKSDFSRYSSGPPWRRDVVDFRYVICVGTTTRWRMRQAFPFAGRETVPHVDVFDSAGRYMTGGEELREARGAPLIVGPHGTDVLLATGVQHVSAGRDIVAATVEGVVIEREPGDDGGTTITAPDGRLIRRVSPPDEAGLIGDHWVVISPRDVEPMPAPQITEPEILIARAGGSVSVDPPIPIFSRPGPHVGRMVDLETGDITSLRLHAAGNDPTDVVVGYDSAEGRGWMMLRAEEPEPVRLPTKESRSIRLWKEAPEPPAPLGATCWSGCPWFRGEEQQQYIRWRFIDASDKLFGNMRVVLEEGNESNNYTRRIRFLRQVDDSQVAVGTDMSRVVSDTIALVFQSDGRIGYLRADGTWLWEPTQ